MPSPLGHALGAYALAQTSRASANNRKLLLYAIAVACFPDVDVIPGIMIGPRGFHRHGITHSFLAAILVSIAAAVWARSTRRNVRYIFGLTLAMYGSHLLLDMLRVSPMPYDGLQILWPLDRTYFNLPIHIFGHTTQSTPDTVLPTGYVVWANIRMIALEVVVLAPIAVIARVLRLRRDRHLRETH